MGNLTSKNWRLQTKTRPGKVELTNSDVGSYLGKKNKGVEPKNMAELDTLGRITAGAYRGGRMSLASFYILNHESKNFFDKQAQVMKNEDLETKSWKGKLWNVQCMVATLTSDEMVNFETYK